MKEVEIFYLTGCPYCKNARRAVEELCAENSAYRELKLNWIEERERPEIAEKYDYYSVPSLFYGGEKLYEAHRTHSYDVIKQHIRSAFDHVLSA
ncbi:MAG: thioredoxin family protein [Oscillospiraceae bacterium]|nr:thioredoxin family protein [Oscillospiraceae bacterium]